MVYCSVVMGQKIRILPENLCNKIAAGEVVERPASVVKELVENSLDAGANEVRIDIEHGGKKLIRMMDNGSGMSREDALLCLERHATSKIRTDADLFNIRTLGFRGEALPSIAAVSRFLLRTSTAGSHEGWEVYLEGGSVIRSGPVGFAGGTVIEVRDLFFNLPARRKFLRRDETELGHISDVVTKMALAHPEVRFALYYNGKPLLEAPRHALLDDRIAKILGRSVLPELLSVRAEFDDGIALNGMISNPSLNRASAGNIYAFINGRFIRDRVVQHAIMEGYRTLLEKGRYPVAVLFIDIDPTQVDVNVHPTKQEVRFRDQKAVHSHIVETISASLRPSSWLATSESSDFVTSSGYDSASITDNFEITTKSAIHPPLPGLFAGEESYRHRVRESINAYASTNSDYDTRNHQTFRPLPSAVHAVTEPKISSPGFFSSLEIIGQYHNTYILCQDRNDLILIDQHAAHERIRFERLKNQYDQGNIERQILLFPVTVDFDFREATIFEDHRDELEQFGFDMEPFGGKTYVLKAVPAILDENDAIITLRDVAAELAVVGASGLARDALEKVLSVMACHSAVRANRPLDVQEMSALLKELDTIDFSAHCPHGRPVLRRLSLSDVEKMFRRT